MNEDHHNGHRTRRAGAFFGRRKAKPLKPAQQVLVENLLPQLRIDLEQDAPSDLGSLFANNCRSFVLEIGFGAGEHFVQRASEPSDFGFIGCEPFVNGLAAGLSLIDEHDLHNVRLYDEDATGLLDWLPDGSIDVIYLLYPDPWPKKRHWKRRFVNKDNMTRFARILKSGGEFRFASDIDHYVNWTLGHFLESPEFSWKAKTAADWKNPWTGWQSTRYERKAIREGRKSAYLTFVKC